MSIPGRPDPTEFIPDFAGYVAEIGNHEDILAVLADQLGAALARLRGLAAPMGDHRYAPEKWTIKEMVGHLSDTERVFAFRALWIARQEPSPQPGYDDQRWVPRAGAERRTLAEMAEEWGHVRRATLALLRPLAPEDWGRRGVAGDGPITVRALAYVIAGHTRHHLRVLEARYLG